MSLTQLWQKIKARTSSLPTTAESEIISFNERGEVERLPRLRQFFLAIVIILVATLSFGIGRLTSVGEREAIKIEYDPSLASLMNTPAKTSIQTASAIDAVSPATTASQAVVASKNGTKYHYAHCSGAKQIKPENRIEFATPEAAQASGYTLAANCKPSDKP